jgi:hypothetical protein
VIQPGGRQIAFITGKYDDPSTWIVAFANPSDGRMVGRLSGTKGAFIDDMTFSTDGKMIYYVASGSVWSIPVADRTPRRLAAGLWNIAVDPNGQDLITIQGEKEAYRLVRISVAGGNERPLPWSSPLRYYYFSSGAVGPDRRILLSVLSPDSWWIEAAILDPKTGKVEKLNVPYSGNLISLYWMPDGKILAAAQRMQASLWRFRQEKP